MAIQYHFNLATMTIGAALALAACGNGEATDPQGTGSITQAANGWNGNGWNGNGWNGNGWNGNGWNGNGWNGNGWNGNGWNGNGWNGSAWGGTGSAQDCTITPNNNNCTTLHDWVNHTDANGNGISGWPNDTDDISKRVAALATWVDCACAPSVTIPFTDTHGTISTTFYGHFGLAPTWCGSNTSAVVPESEMEIVSACIMARINMKGKHYPLSLRSLEAGTAVTTNESWVSGRPLARYWGNLWTLPYADYDTTTPVSSDLTQSGGTWWNLNRFSCSTVPSTSMLISDQLAFGRDCEVSTCGNHLEYLGLCTASTPGIGFKLLGNFGQWNPTSNGYYYQGADATYTGNLVPGGLNFTSVPIGSQAGGSNLSTAVYRNHNSPGWRVMDVFGPYSIAIEDPLSTPPAHPDSSSFPGGPAIWTQAETGAGSIPSSQSSYCTSYDQRECQPPPGGGNGRKLFGLTSSQAISINLSGNAAPPHNFVGDPQEAMSLAIRYSRPTLLGPGQCDVDANCSTTSWFECASGSVSTNGCIGGTASPGLLNIWVNNNIPNSSGWAFVHGSGSPYAKNIFLPTYSDTQYNTAYIYPIYMQNSSSSIAGWTDLDPSQSKVDTLRTWMSGTTSNTGDAPNMDAAYYFPGAPPPDANCTGSAACFLFAGPSLGYNGRSPLSLGLSQQWVYPTTNMQTGQPMPLAVPPGTYTFYIAPDANSDADLYVKVNGNVSLTSYDCRPYLGRGQAETCVVTLSAPGTISVLVNGFGFYGTNTSVITAVLGHN